MSDFTFNGVSASDLGLTINRMPQGGRGAQRYTTASVPGRDSLLYRTETAFEDYSDEIVINCNNHAPRVVTSWLKGSGWSATTDSTGKRRWVRFFGEASVERWRPYNTSEDIVTVPMICEPFQFDASDPATALTNGQTLTGQGDWYARPLIAISGRNDVTLMLNATTYLISLGSANKTLYIDTDAKTAYTLVEGVPQSAALAGVTITLLADEPDTRWGRLNYDSSNAISWTGSNVSGVSIRPRWRWF